MKHVIVLLLLTLTFTSCGVSYLTVPVQKPSEFNTAKFENASIGEFASLTNLTNEGKQIEMDLTRAIQTSKRFKVVDKNFAKSAKDLTMLISGTVDEYNYNEDDITYSTYKDEKGKQQTSFKRTGYVSLSITFQIASMEDGELIGVKTLNEKVTKEVTALNARPAEINHTQKMQMVSEARNKMVESFMKSIVPYTVNVQVELRSDDAIPELAQGIEYAKKGEWNRAKEIFQKGTGNNQSENIHKAFYNLGVACLYSFDFECARNSIEKAKTISPYDQLYKDMLTKCSDMEYEYNELQAQKKKTLSK